jgi:uncharacterized protein YcbK (DUF882 family)
MSLLTEKIADNFSRGEFVCGCGCWQAPVDSKLVEGLQELRNLANKEFAHLGKEIQIDVTSGYRCREHNTNITGKATSRHLTGQAADIRLTHLTTAQMYNLARQIPQFKQGGIGIYPDEGDCFIHVDTRPYIARWARLEGEYVRWRGGPLTNENTP